MAGFWDTVFADVEKGAQFICKLVEGGVPFAAIAGSATGNPEVGAIATVAGSLAGVLDAQITAHDAEKTQAGYDPTQSAMKTANAVINTIVAAQPTLKLDDKVVVALQAVAKSLPSRPAGPFGG